MPRLQQLVHDCLYLQMRRHGTSFDGLANEDMIHEAQIEASVNGVRQQTTLEHQSKQLRVIRNLRHIHTI